MALGWLKDRLSDVADSVWDAATEVADAASGVLDVVDDTVLDTIDTATGEIDIRHSADLIDQGFDFGLTHDGLNASGHAGVDWSPLPYAEALPRSAPTAT